MTARRGSPTRAGASAAWVRDLDRDALEEKRRAERLALTYGHCNVCNVDVGEDGMHAWCCTAVPTSRRANHGRAPAPAPRCQALKEDDRPCGEAAEWSTDDLGEVHHVCDACSRELMMMNDFRKEALR